MRNKGERNTRNNAVAVMGENRWICESVVEPLCRGARHCCMGNVIPKPAAVLICIKCQCTPGDNPSFLQRKESRACPVWLKAKKSRDRLHVT